jgi:hypothetical protein
VLLAVGGPVMATVALLLFTFPIWAGALFYLGEKLRWWAGPPQRPRSSPVSHAKGSGETLPEPTASTGRRSAEIQPLSASTATFLNRSLVAIALVVFVVIVFQSCGRGRVMTPSERYYWDYGEGRAIRDEQEYYQDQIPRGR